MELINFTVSSMQSGLRSISLLALLLALLGLAALLGVSCGGASSTAALLVALPQDEAPHDTGIEWWYFNGLLTDGAGNDYSYHFVTFRSKSEGYVVPHLLQASLGVHSGPSHYTGENVLLKPLEPAATGVDVRVAGWEMRGDGSFYRLKFDLGGHSLEFEATPTRPPVLHQVTGLVSLGPVGDTFYYSRTRLDIIGTIQTGGVRRTLTGTSWMDHQWGDVAGQGIGWDWASLQLDDGSDLMAFLVWDPKDHQVFARYATLVTGDGAVRYLSDGELAFTASGSWTSQQTGIVYPMNWRITADSLGLDLALTPVLKNAEFADSDYIPVPYWEGAVTVEGTRDGNDVTGRGFVELVGYGSQANDGPANQSED